MTNDMEWCQLQNDPEGDQNGYELNGYGDSDGGWATKVVGADRDGDGEWYEFQE